MIELVEPENGVAEIVMNRPGRHNALTRKLWSDLRDTVMSIPSNAPVVLLRGAGRDFTSGLDLSDLAGLTVEEVDAAFLLMEEAIAAVEGLQMPVVAMLDGYVLGGGLELALAADIRVSSARVQIGMPVAKLGILLSHDFARRIACTIGVSRAKELILTGRLLSAQEALRCGAVNAVEDSGVVYQRALSLCRSIKGHYPSANRRAKSAVNEIAAMAAITEPDHAVDPQEFFEAVKEFGTHSGFSRDDAIEPD